MDRNICGYTQQELQEKLSKFPKFRSKQVFNWIHNKLISSYNQASNLGKELTKYLEENFSLNNVEIEYELHSKLDSTSKYLFKLYDASIVEGVILPYRHGRTFCISTQVGCKRGCIFCASTKNGLYRNIETSELLEMYYLMKRRYRDLNHLVFMGSGEPMDNYESVIKMINILHDPQGQNLSYRNITISTCGVIEGIYKLADEGIPVTLSISLHEAIQEKRSLLMPVARIYNLDQLSKSIDYYMNKTKRRVSLEYTLIKDSNDSDQDLKAIRDFINKRDIHVNVIALNPIDEVKLKEPDKIYLNKFVRSLEQMGINATIRREMGRDIKGSCGQLKNKFIKS